MFLIYGWGKKTVKNYGSTLKIKCGNCNNDGHLNLVRVRFWNTFFFIPIIPYKTNFHFICNTCSISTDLHGKDIKKAKYYNKLTRAYNNKQITEENYNSLLSSPDGFVKTMNPNNNWECPRCNRTNANTAYSCQHCGYRIV